MIPQDLNQQYFINDNLIKPYSWLSVKFVKKPFQNPNSSCILPLALTTFFTSSQVITTC